MCRITQLPEDTNTLATLRMPVHDSKMSDGIALRPFSYERAAHQSATIGVKAKHVHKCVTKSTLQQLPPHTSLVVIVLRPRTSYERKLHQNVTMNTRMLTPKGTSHSQTESTRYNKPSSFSGHHRFRQSDHIAAVTSVGDSPRHHLDAKSPLNGRTRYARTVSQQVLSNNEVLLLVLLPEARNTITLTLIIILI